mgnify:CR=1 FL=1
MTIRIRTDKKGKRELRWYTVHRYDMLRVLSLLTLSPRRVNHSWGVMDHFLLYHDVKMFACRPYKVVCGEAVLCALSHLLP